MDSPSAKNLSLGPSPPHQPTPDAQSARDGGRQLASLHGPVGHWLRGQLASWCGRPDVAEDLLQRTWLGVWQSIHTGRYDPSRASLATFAYAVARNVFRHWARSSAAEAVHGRAPHAPFEVDAPDEVGRAELIDKVRALLFGGRSGLTAGEIAVLRHVATGGTDRELAEALGVSPSTAHQRKRAALESLRRLLEPPASAGGSGAKNGNELERRP